jgi:RasGEF domain/RasGEF N-terminal motif
MEAATPCVLTACKCDQPSKNRKVDPGFNGKIGASFLGVQTGEVSATVPESFKRCIRSILKSILASKETSRQLSPNASRPRAATSQDRTASSRRTSASNSRSHSRSKSDFPGSRSKPYDTPQTSSEVLPETEEYDESSDDDEEDSESDDGEAEEDGGEPAPSRQALKLDTSPSPRPQTRPYEPQTPVSAEGRYINGLMSPFEGGQSDVPQTPDSFNAADIVRPGTADSRAHQTFLFLEEESQDESSHSERHPSISEFERLRSVDKEKNEVGLTFSELIDRLLALPTNKQDKKLSSMFLCLYRAFATPRQLLTSIITRFNEVETSPSVQLTKAALQLRYLQVMGEWTAAYPGDLADAVTRHLAHSFVSRLEKSRTFGPAAKEIGNNLEAYVEDDDLVWSHVEATNSTARTPKLTPQPSTGPGSPNQTTKDARNNRADILPWEYPLEENNDDDSNGDANSSPRHSGAPSTASSLLKAANPSSQSLTNLLNLEHARQKAQKLRPVPRTRLSKIQWHQFMDAPPEDIAREITRIDWIMYSAIRPRDFVRHVMASSKDRKQKVGTLNDNIGTMVKHFNHLAVFVSGMILLRDKPKHRAKAVEKWMTIAWKVRQLNNYNSLGAIVAGINGHEIARLLQTRELVPPQANKDFMRLSILMGLSRGHAAYRLAWENSFTERIPFIPLLRQDLTLASNGMSTWIEKEGEKRINWRKFEVMGEVIVMIQNSQLSGYKFQPKDEEIVKLILETKVLEGSEEDADPRGELYERSVALEAAGTGERGHGHGGGRVGGWFRR